jgi:hypothetical protein
MTLRTAILYPCRYMFSSLVLIGVMICQTHAQPAAPVPVPGSPGHYLYILLRHDIHQPGIIFHEGISRYSQNASLVNEAAGLNDSMLVMAAESFDPLYNVVMRLPARNGAAVRRDALRAILHFSDQSHREFSLAGL